MNETLKTPVTHACDVLVAGGGIAGIAAALAAARQGKQVILLQRGFMLGGLATAIADDMTALDVDRLQTTLRQNGVVIHESDLK